MRRLSKKQRGVYTGWCKNCEKNVTAEGEDYSFDHAFGTHHEYGFSCPNCHEDLPDVDFIEWD